MSVPLAAALPGVAVRLAEVDEIDLVGRTVG